MNYWAHVTKHNSDNSLISFQTLVSSALSILCLCTTNTNYLIFKQCIRKIDTKNKCHTVASSCIKALFMIVEKEVEEIIHRRLRLKHKEPFITMLCVAFK